MAAYWRQEEKVTISLMTVVWFKSKIITKELEFFGKYLFSGQDPMAY